jgi:hypothetical protein
MADDRVASLDSVSTLCEPDPADGGCGRFGDTVERNLVCQFSPLDRSTIFLSGLAPKRLKFCDCAASSPCEPGPFDAGRSFGFVFDADQH